MSQESPNFCDRIQDHDVPSMGTKRWDGTPLYVGYKATITGKEIEVDGSIKQSQMPTIAGKSTEYEDELEFGDPPQTHAQTSFLLDQWESPGVDVKREPAQSPAPTSGPSAKKPYVAPSSFYAHKPAKPKVAAPLYVLCLTLFLNSFAIRVIGIPLLIQTQSK